MKILVCTELLAPYRVDWLNEIGKTYEIDILYLNEGNKERNDKWLSKRPNNCLCSRMHGIKIPKLGLMSFDFLKQTKREKYDCVIIDGYGFFTQVINLIYLRFCTLPVFINVDGLILDDNESRIKYLFKKFLFYHEFNFLCGAESASKCLQYYGVRKENIHHHPFSSLKNDDIDANITSFEEKKVLREKVGIKEDKIIISVGQFIYRKGFDVLIEACNYIEGNIGVYIIGGEPTDNYLELVKKYNLNNIHFISFLDKEELSKYYHAADLFVLPTREDIWGLVINEAMSCGLPVITTDNCVAGKELIENGINGYIVPVGDAISLSEKINIILGDNLMQKRMSEENLRRIREYTVENIAEIHRKILAEKFGGKSE